MLRVQQPGHQAWWQGRVATTEVNEAAKARSISVQPISAANLTSGCFMLSCSSSLDGTTHRTAAAKALDPSDSSEQFARKQGLVKPYLANPTAIKQKKHQSDQWLALFSADLIVPP